MPKQITKTPPPVRDPIITRSHTHMSASGEQIAQGSETISATPVNEQRSLADRYVLVSPTLGPITVEQLLKHNSDNGTEI